MSRPLKKAKSPAQQKTEVMFRDPIFVPIGNVVPNAYNPNKMNPARYAAFCAHVDEVGFMHPISVSPADRNGMYTIIDGEHRFNYLKERGAKEIPVIVMPKNYTGTNAESMLASLRFNIHGDNDGIKLGEVYQAALDANYTPQSLANALGESTADIERITSMLQVDYGDGGGEVPDDPDTEGDEFVTIEIALPKSAWENVVEPEFQRIKDVAGIHHDSDEAIEFGRVVELMAALSAQTPEESLV